MSKKNKKSTKRNLHKFDLEREQQAKEQLQKQQERSQRKSERREAVVADGGVTKRKKKGVRIRKGVSIRGIKVVDADTKKKVIKVLKAEQAAKLMDMDAPVKRKSRKTRSAVAKPLLKISKAHTAAKRAAKAEAMET